MKSNHSRWFVFFSLMTAQKRLNVMQLTHNRTDQSAVVRILFDCGIVGDCCLTEECYPERLDNAKCVLF